MTHNSIDEVILKLDEIIATSLQQQSYLGIFAWVYKRTTEQIRTEIEQGTFEDNPRLEQFDVLFANYYLDALQKYIRGETVSKSWEIAFDSKDEKLTIIQHLLMGMNAHINLDLAVAAAKFMEGKPIADLEHDFNKVNDILAGLLNEMQSKIARASILMFLLDWIGKRSDEKIINFSMVQARTQSWRVANELWSLRGADREDRIKQVDPSIYKLGQFIKNPPSRFLKMILRMISWFEVKQADRIIQLLRS
ncbi:MAG: hypothetical protein KQI35_14580 [Bacteroidetes bacterium]|nr:hypothetical protein [Bacteroidota bacterium]